MGKDNPTFTIIVPTNGQREDSLQRCIESIKKHTKVSYELFIERGGDCVSWAINNGLRKSRGKYITIPNIADDIEVTEGWDTEMVKFLESDTSLGAGVHAVYHPDGSLESYGGFVYPEALNYDPNGSPDYGGYMVVKREVFEKVGLMDENFKPIYCEDADYGLRIWEAGYKIGVCPESKLIHHHAQGGRKKVNQANKDYLLEKHSKKLPKTTAVVLSWNNLSVTKDTIRRLRREVPVIVVDNGSTDGSQLYFADLGDKITYIQMGENKGSSVARNMAISRVKTPYFFLVDGDILYVPDSIKYLEEILDSHPECGCVGVNDTPRVQATGMNGTLNMLEADVRAEGGKAYKGFPMAWTQYGLFRNGIKLPEEYPFDRAGHGYEDDWCYREMKEKGLESYFVTKPLYFHDAHAGKRELNKSNTPTMEKERAEAYFKKWGESWLTKPLNIEEV
jgi:GT2 family glycosyltransferase